MERRRVRGRYVREDGSTGKKPEPAMLRAPRPAQCRMFVLKRIAEAMPELIAMLIAKAKEGSYQHVSILVRLAGLHAQENAKGKAKQRRRGSSVMARLVKELLEERQGSSAAAEQQDSPGV